MNKRISIIGAGISGITTALTLQLLGYETTIYAEHLVEQQTKEDPRFASLYPAASIIPHSIQTDQLDLLFPPSQQMFQYLLNNRMEAVKLHKHYEIYEETVSDPSYRKFFNTFKRIENISSTHIPHRLDTNQIYGWVFDCVFSEFPQYIQKLYTWYRKADGKLRIKTVTPEGINQLDSEVVINCSGIWSSTLFDDDSPRYAIRGHLLHLKDAPMIYESNTIISSYNYTPKASVYSDPSGKATDVYYYPRTDGWILGGSRQPGTVNENGVWEGVHNNETIEINGVAVPKQIFELNRTIINNTYGIDISRYTNVKAKMGYRYVRSLDKSGLRLEKTSMGNKRIVHNYGHGGAGVTLSWGCALRVAQMIQNKNLDSETENIDRVQQKLQQFLK